MLAKSCASAGSTVASRRTRLVAEACSAARSRASVTWTGAAAPARPDDRGDERGEACALAVPAVALAVPEVALAGAVAVPGGWTSRARSCARCCSCWVSSGLSADDLAVAGEWPSSAVRYNEIRFSSAAITAWSVTTSGAGRGRPASGSGPVNMSEDRQPAVASSIGSAVAEASRMRRLGRMSGTPASYHVLPAGRIGVRANSQIG